jgi:hypothetical protein
MAKTTRQKVMTALRRVDQEASTEGMVKITTATVLRMTTIPMVTWTSRDSRSPPGGSSRISNTRDLILPYSVSFSVILSLAKN